ncbi:hypothetical protein WICPIJ_005588 [Wickerhamomyces pijperi]|uniref:Uncharacterized protein n=1 Tax=Wickerhamomyces pijperi TaxID=599730 RepID=A0A9P8TLN9_WICPI|nr:hypothetical protein WICPIJ_005588 [Wickerhamomyces pijperi]
MAKQWNSPEAMNLTSTKPNSRGSKVRVDSASFKSPSSSSDSSASMSLSFSETLEVSLPKTKESLLPQDHTLLSASRAKVCIPPTAKSTIPFSFKNGFKRGLLTSLVLASGPNPNSHIEPVPHTKTSNLVDLACGI